MFVVWTVSSPWPTKTKPRCRPYSLYTFFPAGRKAWLGIGTIKAIRAFPEFERIHRGVSYHGAQFKTLGILCSILLSYADKQGDDIAVTIFPQPGLSHICERQEPNSPSSLLRIQGTDKSLSAEIRIVQFVYAI